MLQKPSLPCGRDRADSAPRRRNAAPRGVEQQTMDLCRRNGAGVQKIASIDTAFAHSSKKEKARVDGRMDERSNAIRKGAGRAVPHVGIAENGERGGTDRCRLQRKRKHGSRLEHLVLVEHNRSVTTLPLFESDAPCRNGVVCARRPTGRKAAERSNSLATSRCHCRLQFYFTRFTSTPRDCGVSFKEYKSLETCVRRDVRFDGFFRGCNQLKGRHFFGHNNKATAAVRVAIAYVRHDFGTK